MNMVLFLLVIIPLLCAIALYFAPRSPGKFKEIFFIAAALFNLAAVCFYFGQNVFYYNDWAAFNFSISAVLYGFKGLLLVVAAFFALLSAVFTLSNMKGNQKAPMFKASLLLAVSFINGALITDSLLLMLAFIEALAIPFVLMILSSKENSKRLAVKSFVITAIADLFLMMGIALVYALSGSLNISDISLNLGSVSGKAAFLFFAIGAAGKLGVMPFHSWMSEAGEKTPVAFMVFMATAAEKILGVYLLYVAIKIFNVVPSCSVFTGSIMAVAAISAVLSALMANSRNTFKGMLVYTSVSQGSFIMLAMLTAVPVAIAGAVLHLLAHTAYKSCMFFAAGIMDETKSKTIAYAKNPYIFSGFIFALASFIGVPLFAAFYSKEMIYAGSLQAGAAWCVVMLVVTFFNSSAALNWFAKIFFTKEGETIAYPVASMIATISTAALCLLLGVFSGIPLKIIGLQIRFEQEHSGLLLVIVSSALLVVVLVNFITGFAKYGNGLGFVSGLLSVFGINKFDAKKKLDPYNVGMRAYRLYSKGAFDFDRGLNWIYDSLFVNAALKCSHAVKTFHNGSMSRYIMLALAGIAVIVLFFIR
ncbi:MAG: hypothetical protein FWC57_03425 [Endomicrobia bacterium]|nr:hypothetical protein [Endomicrobiia bacterium]